MGSASTVRVCRTRMRPRTRTWGGLRTCGARWPRTTRSSLGGRVTPRRSDLGRPSSRPVSQRGGLATLPRVVACPTARRLRLVPWRRRRVERCCYPSTPLLTRRLLAMVYSSPRRRCHASHLTRRRPWRRRYRYQPYTRRRLLLPRGLLEGTSGRGNAPTVGSNNAPQNSAGATSPLCGCPASQGQVGRWRVVDAQGGAGSQP